MPLYLLPNVFDDNQSPALLLPSGLKDIVINLDGLIAESERSGRRYLLKITEKDPRAREIPIFLLNEHNKDASEAISLISQGKMIGLVSDAGMPGVADPGAEVVSALRQKGVRDIHAIPGPSSILLALVLSGLGGQRFSFHGYLPRELRSRQKMLRQLEKESRQQKMTQICIEAPYRNKALFTDCLAILDDSTELAVAKNLTFSDERVEVKSIGEWKRCRQDPLGKEPMVFLFVAR